MHLIKVIFILFYKELTEIFLKSENPEELKYYWQQWYDKAGTPTRKNFDTYLRLNKEAAILNSKRIVTFLLIWYSDLNS